MFILNLLLFIVVLGIIILIHELGHFFFAKRAGILCHEFSIGMGPALYQKRKGETVYSIRAIPIGGYVSMAGESINDALIKNDQVIGVKINDQDQIYEIILNSELESDKVGIVKDFDLYGKDFNPLFITLEIEGEEVKYQVLRDALYRIGEKRELWITPSEKSFETKTLWERFLVIFAGPFMNFVLALFIFIIVAIFVQKPNLDSNEVGEVVSKYPANLIGLTTNDQILSINGENISSWYDLSDVMGSLTTSTIDVTYLSDGNTVVENDVPVVVVIQMAGISNVYVDPDTKNVSIYHDTAVLGQVFGRADKGTELQAGDIVTQIDINGQSYTISNWDDIINVFNLHRSGEVKIYYTRDDVNRTKVYDLISETALNKLGSSAIVFQLGIAPTGSFDWAYSLRYPFRAFNDNMTDVFVTIGLLFTPSENLGISDLSGPIGIFDLVSSTASKGILSILSFTAFLSINIGMLNLLPIPALDGGRLVFLGIEAVTRKPLNRKFENSINNIMFILLLALFVYVAFNDLFG